MDFSWPDVGTEAGTGKEADVSTACTGSHEPFRTIRVFLLRFPCRVFVFRFVDVKLQPSTSGHLSIHTYFLTILIKSCIKIAKKSAIFVNWTKNRHFPMA